MHNYYMPKNISQLKSAFLYTLTYNIPLMTQKNDILCIIWHMCKTNLIKTKLLGIDYRSLYL